MLKPMKNIIIIGMMKPLHHHIREALPTLRQEDCKYAEDVTVFSGAGGSQSALTFG